MVNNPKHLDLFFFLTNVTVWYLNILKPCTVQITIAVSLKDEITSSMGGCKGKAELQGPVLHSVLGNAKAKENIPTACFPFLSKNTLPSNFSWVSK